MRYAMNTLCIRRFAQTAALIAILGLSACSAMKNGFEPERADYRKTQSSPALVIPADLRPVVPESDQRLQAPSATFGPLKDRKSTRLNSSHQIISYAVFCLKKKKKHAMHTSLILQYWNEEEVTIRSLIRERFKQDFLEVAHIEGLWELKNVSLFFFNDTATTEIYTLSLHDALPI